MSEASPPAVPYFDYRPAYERHRAEILCAIERVLDSGRLVLGPEVEAFEQEFAAWCGVPHAVGVNSGTDALILALRALEIGAEDEVITVANAGAPTVAAIRAVGAHPRFVDVSASALTLDPERLAAALTKRTRCVLPIHLYGNAAAIEPICDFASANGLFVVEDCAQAHGTTHDGRQVGGFGDIGCFSFYPTKNLGAFGDGGACVTRDAALAERVRMLRMYGFRGDRHAHCEGLNSRLDELQAAILRVKLRRLDGEIEERRVIACRYLDAFAQLGFDLPRSAPGAAHAYHLFVVQVADRARAIRALTERGVGYGVHYPDPVHRMEAYRFLGGQEGDLPISETACREVLSLPLYPGLTGESVERVVEAVLAAAHSRSPGA